MTVEPRYYDYHLIGESSDRANNFALPWALPAYQILRGRHLITARAFDDQGLESQPTDAGDHVILFDEPAAVTGRKSSDLRFELDDCFPNPVNPSTRIPFTLAAAGPIRLVVYNALGEEILTLADTFLSAGAHEVTLDGPRLPSGLYFYALEQGVQRQVKKMLVLR